MKLTIIVAVAENGVIGRGSELPWRLPADFRHFKRATMGHHLLMGRRTFESIGRALPGRTTVVISRGRPELPEGARRAGSLAEAIAIARDAGDDEAFVAGGAAIYRRALPLADRMLLTRVAAFPEGDVEFPRWERHEWRLVSRQDRRADEENPHAMTFLEYERRRSRDGP